MTFKTGSNIEAGGTEKGKEKKNIDMRTECII
jgi:hypothetical protein